MYVVCSATRLRRSTQKNGSGFSDLPPPEDARQREMRAVVHATALPAFAVMKGRLFAICAWGSMQLNALLQQAYIAGSALTDPRYEVER
jgi:hypothetical protein